MNGTKGIISGDSHVEVDSKLWVHRVDQKYRDRAPRVVRLPNGGDGWVIEGQPPRQVASDLYGGKGRDIWQPFGQRYEDTPGTGPGEQRIKEQDRDGIAGEVLFPNQQAGPKLWRNIKDNDAYKAVVRGYNDWLGEEYCAVAPDRLLGIGVMPKTNVKDAIAEMEHCAKTGMMGVLLTNFPSNHIHPTDEDDEFWKAALDINMPVTVHVDLDRSGVGVELGQSGPVEESLLYYPKDSPQVRAMIGRNGLVEQVTRFGPVRGSGSIPAVQLALSGVFDRFPDLRIFFAENQIGWIPFFLQMADVRYDRHVHWAQRLLGFEPLKRLPSEIIREHCWWGFQFDRVGVEMRHHIGVDRVMWGSDFPHQESDWPDSRTILERNFAGVPEDEAYKMSAGNVIEFFHL